MKLTETILLARELMERHKLNGWKLKFDESRSHLGLCKYSEKTIYLSILYTEINDNKVIRNTILHEIAHALAGSRNGHNRIWRTIAKSIGCTGERCTSGAHNGGRYAEEYKLEWRLNKNIYNENGNLIT